MMTMDDFGSIQESNCECLTCRDNLKDGDEVKTFRSPAKYTPGQGLTSKEPCPVCGGHALGAIRSDMEVFT